jgi:hypothetical protein
VNTPLTGPASLPFDVEAIETVLVSLSLIFNDAVRFAGFGSSATPTFPAEMPVKVSTTLSVSSTRLSSITATLIVAVVAPAGMVTAPLRGT